MCRFVTDFFGENSFSVRRRWKVIEEFLKECKEKKNGSNACGNLDGRALLLDIFAWLLIYTAKKGKWSSGCGVENLPCRWTKGEAMKALPQKKTVYLFRVEDDRPPSLILGRLLDFSSDMGQRERGRRSAVMVGKIENFVRNRANFKDFIDIRLFGMLKEVK